MLLLVMYQLPVHGNWMSRRTFEHYRYYASESDRDRAQEDSRQGQGRSRAT